MPKLDARWYAVAALIVVAVLAGVADWRRRHRRDPDRIGPVHWPTVQVLALIAALALGLLTRHR
jgi:hypothetical protein